jgi:hypothetical protein
MSQWLLSNEAHTQERVAHGQSCHAYLERVCASGHDKGLGMVQLHHSLYLGPKHKVVHDVAELQQEREVWAYGGGGGKARESVTVARQQQRAGGRRSAQAGA